MVADFSRALRNPRTVPLKQAVATMRKSQPKMAKMPWNLRIPMQRRGQMRQQMVDMEMKG
jgi:hypothetical protein